VAYEDSLLLVIDKPAGMVVHAGPGHSAGTLVNAVLHHLGAALEDLPTLPGNGPERPGIVHRLDRDTSGLIVVAKTLPAQVALAAQFRDHSIDRAYLGVVQGKPTFGRLRLETGHGRDPSERRRFAPNQGTRRAITTMTYLGPHPARPDVSDPPELAAPEHPSKREREPEVLSLVRFTLETGRTHQIRMHARHVDHPIFADPLYGRRPRDPQLRALADSLGRHALHATLLGFQHPDPARGRMRLESSLPAALQFETLNL